MNTDLRNLNLKTNSVERDPDREEKERQEVADFLEADSEEDDDDAEPMDEDSDDEADDGVGSDLDEEEYVGDVDEFVQGLLDEFDRTKGVCGYLLVNDLSIPNVSKTTHDFGKFISFATTEICHRFCGREEKRRCARDL